MNSVRTTHWMTQHNILQQCHCDYFKYHTVLSVTKSVHFWLQTVPFEHGLCSHHSVLYTSVSQPPGCGPVRGPGIHYTGPWEAWGNYNMLQDFISSVDN